MSDDIINATISIEDKHFFKHQGFDFLRIIKAMYTNIINGAKVQGASTITQQYAKNLFLDFGKTWKRKFEEAWLTIRLETQYSKEEILEGYLNTINYGGIFGIENASKYYFDKSASDLNLAEAAILAGIPKSPSNYSPLSNFEEAKKRQALILSSMVRNGFISEKDKNEAIETELILVGSNKENKSSMIMYYQDAVIHELKKLETIPKTFLEIGGLKIFTNMDPNAMKSIEDSINKNLEGNKEIQVAAIAMDPNTGAVTALTGGRDYSVSQFNRAIKSKRQVGSTMKPLLYYAALENSFTPSTTFRSEKTIFTFSEDKTYSPQNYGDEYPNKPISMATAIAYSDNIYAVKTHLFLGEETLVETAKRLGITSPIEAVPSLALGSYELNIMEMTKAYSTFANEGYNITPHLIQRVEDLEGNVLYEFKEEKELVLNKSLVYVLNELLTTTYSRDLIDYNYPTCYNISYKMTKKYAVKTGTTDTDHLIFGYNKDLIIGIWTGYDDNKPTIPSDGLAIKNAWVDSMESYLKDKEDNWYQLPSNVVGVLVDPISGKLATNNTKNKKIMYYIKGTEPTNKEASLDDSIPTVKIEE
ncbi:MAG TPA: PBP1A family penicillin-binding protein [Tenericutes bacterium]|nr:PBP1A family penicillin-binding protein [Mycoplasmatota bacterium]